MRRERPRPSPILIINTILVVLYYGACIGLGAAEHLS